MAELKTKLNDGDVKSRMFKGQVQYPYTFLKGKDFPVSIVKD